MACTPSIAYTSATGNVPLVKVKGVEIDGVYAGIPNTTMRFSGAYNDAYYADFPNLAQPVENGYPGAAPYRDASGENSAGLVQVRVQSRRGLPRAVQRGARVPHQRATPRGRTSSTATSRCRVMRGFPDRAIVDLSVGVGTRSGSFDVSLLLKNALDDDTHVAQTWNSYGPAFPRWWGVVFSGKL